MRIKINLISIFFSYVLLQASHGFTCDAGSIERTLTLGKAGNIGAVIKLKASNDGNQNNRLHEKLKNLNEEPLSFLNDSKSDQIKFLNNPNDADTIEEQNPIFLLDECSEKTCGFTRKEDKLTCPRNAALEVLLEVSSELPTKSPVIASYASGNLFFELQTLIKLRDNGYQVSKFVIIDHIYEPILDLVHIFGIQGNIKQSELINIMKNYFRGTNLPVEKNIRFIGQFIEALNALHDGCELLVFYDACAYSLYCQDSDEIYHPNLIFGLDYFISQNSKQDYDRDFGALLGITLKNNVFSVMVDFKAYKYRTGQPFISAVITSKNQRRERLTDL